MAEGEGDEGGNTVRRAVKMLRGGATAADKTEFTSEVSVMLDLEHDNLVNVRRKKGADVESEGAREGLLAKRKG